MKLFYVEKDGSLFLVEKKDLFCLPTREEVPFPFEELRPLMMPGAEVAYCRPEPGPHPGRWVHKDEVPSLRNIHPLARLAVNRTLVRHVSDAVVVDGDSVLMVKASRGLVPDVWDLPGGFINYGESPEESLIREVKEETGLEVRVNRLLSTSASVSREHSLYFLALFYVCEVVGGSLKPEPGEISEARWMTVKEAIRAAKEGFIKDALKGYLKFQKPL